MALKVWLPLNGDLENKGSSNLLFATQGSSLSITSDGKLGKTYTKSASSGGIASDKQVDLGNHLTMCAWVNVKEFNSSSNLTGVLGQHRYSTKSGLSINLKYKSSTTGYICCSTGDGTNRTYESYYGTTVLNVDKWYHLCLTYDGEKIKLYVNGNLDKEVSYTTQYNISDCVYLYAWTLSGTTGNSIFNSSANYNLTGRLNDVRFYDECLSQKEIKEIAKCLLVHYKLDTPRALNNLKRNALYSTYNNYSSSGSTATVTETGEIFNGAKVYRLTYTPNDTSLSHVQTTLHGHGVYTSSATYLANTKYCYWTLCKPISHKDTIVGGNASNIGGWTEIPMKEYGGGWYIVGQYRNGTVTSDKTDAIFTSFKTPSATSGTPITIDFCCPHLISGYMSIIPENNYLGTTLAEEADCSGFSFNGPIGGTLNYDTNTVKYSGATNFSSGYIHKAPSPLNANSDEFTISCWFYPTQNSTGCIINDRKITGDAIAIFYYGGGIRFDTGTSYQWQIGSITLNAWNFIAVSWSKITGTKKFYLNGALVGSTTSYGSLANIGDLFSIGASSTNGAAGSSNQIKGSLSDFRIYGTQLSDDDILYLYKTGGIIDSEQNYGVFELKEDSSTLAYANAPSGYSNYGDTFSSATVNDAESPTGKAFKLTCTAVGTGTSHGYYISAEPWTSAKTKMIHGKTYELSMYVKMNKSTSSFRMTIECASSQSQTIFGVGTTYKRIVNTFVYNKNTTYSAITNYSAIFAVGDTISMHSIKVTSVDTQPKLYKSGTLDSSNFSESDKTKIYKSSIESNKFIEI